MKCLSFALALAVWFGVSSMATDRHVAKSGSDTTGNGTIGNPYFTATKAYSVCSAGDRVLIDDSGLYDENPRFDRAGSAGNLIVIDGQNNGSILNAFSCEADYNMVCNLTTYTNASTWHVRTYFHNTANHCIVSNVTWDNKLTLLGYPAVAWNGAVGGVAGSFNTITNCKALNIRDEMIFRIGGDFNQIGGIYCSNIDNADLMQFAGHTNYVTDFTAVALVQMGVYTNNHADCFQMFGNAGGTAQESWGHIINRMFVYVGNQNPNPELQIGNLTDDELSNVGKLRVWNSIFVGVPSKCSVAQPQTEFVNCLFLNCATNANNGGAALIGSDLNGIGHGTSLKYYNNIFANCGIAGLTNNGNGWYHVDTTLTGCEADYNIVTKKIGGVWKAIEQDSNTNHYVHNGGTWDANLWFEPHGLNGVDPKFSNESQLDFRLLPGSPAISSALAQAGFTNDFRLLTRDASWEIGPYEFQQSDFNTYPGDVGPRLILATTIANSGATTINIPYNLDRQEIKIGRRKATSNPSAWTVFTNLVTLNSASVTNSISFTDTNIANVTYEYEIQQLIRTNALTGGDVNGYRDFQYPWTAYRAPLQDSRGNVCLLVESGVAASLTSELTRLNLDLVGAGYKVYRHDIAADEVGSGTWKTNVTGIKSLIQTDYNSDGNPWFVFIVGHVPVPYSGLNLSPGSHTDNKGAHATDLYYADLDGTFTDAGSETSAPATFTQNVPGDGKFDNDTIPSAPEVRIGRVDLGHSNFSAFSNTEVQRLRQYLDRDHQWRHKQFTVRNKAMIYYGPNPGLQVDAKPLEGHDLMAGYFGNTTSVDLGSWLPLSHDTNNTYLFALEMGEGAIDRSIQLGTSANFNATNLYAVFTSSYGSYYGSWDSMNTNAFLKSILANGGYPLTTSYRENYVNIGSSAMDEPISYEEFAEQSQFALVGSGKEYTWYIRVIGGSGVTSLVNFPTKMFESLFGDPTLLAHQVEPVSNLAVNASGADNVVTWSAPVSETGVQGYHVLPRASGQLKQLHSVDIQSNIGRDLHGYGRSLDGLHVSG
jgi:hypothetical protein